MADYPTQEREAMARVAAVLDREAAGLPLLSEIRALMLRSAGRFWGAAEGDGAQRLHDVSREDA